MSKGYRELGRGLLIVLAAAVCYPPALRGGFIWDDHVFLLNNKLIVASDGLFRSFFTIESPDYFPLTTASLWLEWRLWGERPAGYHATNILLHALAAVLLWRALALLFRGRGLAPGGAFAAALVFAAHPAAVMSVAWIAERKNTLSLVLAALSLLLYLRAEERRGAKLYILALAAFLAALLAKTSVVMLPAVMLGCVWWLRGRIERRDVSRVLPFFGLALALGLATVWFQRHNAMRGQKLDPYDFFERLATAGQAAWFYIGKVVWPARLCPFYEWSGITGALRFLPAILLAAVFVALWLMRGRWGRGPLFALGALALLLLPVLGFLDMSFRRLSPVSDHLQYIVLVAPPALAAGALSRLARRGRRLRAAAIAATAAIVLALGVMSWAQSGMYVSERDFWLRTAELNPGCWTAHDWLGRAAGDAGRAELALAGFARAIELKPDYANAYNSRATFLHNRGELEAALTDVGRALELAPRAASYLNRGNIYFDLKRFEEAATDVAEALKLDPDFAPAYSARGRLRATQGDYAGAVGDFSEALRLQPGYATALFNRGLALRRMGEYKRAARDFDAVLRDDPRDAAAYAERAACFLELGDVARARKDARECLRLGGRLPTDLARKLEADAAASNAR